MEPLLPKKLRSVCYLRMHCLIFVHLSFKPSSARLPHAPTLSFLAQNECPSVEAGQLFHQDCGPSVVTAEVLERCKVQRGSVRCSLGDPSHVCLLMLPWKRRQTPSQLVSLFPGQTRSVAMKMGQIWIFALLCEAFKPLFLWVTYLFCCILQSLMRIENWRAV